MIRGNLGLVTFLLLFPSNDVGPLNTVLRLSRNGCKGAKRNGGTWGVHVKLALNTRSHGRKYHPGLTLKP